MATGWRKNKEGRSNKKPFILLFLCSNICYLESAQLLHPGTACGNRKCSVSKAARSPACLYSTSGKHMAHTERTGIPNNKNVYRITLPTFSLVNIQNIT